MNPNPAQGRQSEIKNYYPQIIEAINSNSHFNGANLIFIESIDYGSAKGSMKISQLLRNSKGGVHGGALSTLADSVAGSAVASLGHNAVTLNNTMNYLRSANGDKVYCIAEVVRDGRTITVCDARLFDSDDRLIATGTFTFYTTGDITSFFNDLEHTK